MDATEGIRWPEEFHPSRTPVHVRNELAMAAPVTAVWACLVGARAWPSWYPNARDVVIDGAGTELTSKATFKWRTFGIRLVSHVEEFVPQERLAWNARGLAVWVYHAWLIHPTPSGCTVVTEETQHGFAARLGALLMPRRMHHWHQVWLEQLEKRALLGPPGR